MNRSESIVELAKSLCKAQATLTGAIKDKANDHFRSKYADLAACWDAARIPLTSNGLSVAQFPRMGVNGVEVETVLMHTSGEWMSETLTIPVSKNDAHGVGSAITYGRRFGFCALVGISPEDDDGNAAAKGVPGPSPWTPELKDLAAEAANGGDKGYKAWWLLLSKEARATLVATQEHADFKKAAAMADSDALAAAARGDNGAV